MTNKVFPPRGDRSASQTTSFVSTLRSATCVVGVNGRFLTKPYTGIGQHTLGLFRAMAVLEPAMKIVMAVPFEVGEIVSGIEHMGNFEVCILPEIGVGTAGMKKTFWEQVQVPAFFARQGVDVAHFPYPSNPWKGFSKPVCVTVHDTIPWEDKAYRRSFLTRRYQDAACLAVKKADHVFAVSEDSRADVQRLSGVPDAKISMSYNAPAAQFSERLSVEMRAAILKKYGLDPARRYFFYIGGYDERKNVRTLVEAFSGYVAPAHDVDLVLAGGKAVNDRLYASFDHAASAKNVRVTGFVTEEDLPALYQSAVGFVTVSLKEGCNLPLLEALSSGIPVIASDIPVHREMAGNNATYVGARDVASLGKAMNGLIAGGGHDGPRQNYDCPFSWEKTAQAVFNIYKKLV